MKTKAVRQCTNTIIESRLDPDTRYLCEVCVMDGDDDRSHLSVTVNEGQIVIAEGAASKLLKQILEVLFESRVSDFFNITDKAYTPQQEQLRDLIYQRLEEGLNRKKGE